MPALLAAMRTVGERLRRLMETHGRIADLAWNTLRGMFSGSFETKETVRQIEYLAINSLSISLLTALFTGMVMALQFSISLDRFGGREYVSVAVAVAIVRELGPVLTSVVVGGRVGSGIAAELGSMAVTEQIDAIRALGADPVRKLVVPRMVAMILGLPMLTFLAIVVGITGGMLISMLELGINWHTYMWDSINGLTTWDLISGVSKTFVFAIGLTLIACYEGMTTTGGTEGVGQATTRTVVVSLIFIFVADFFLTKLLLMF